MQQSVAKVISYIFHPLLGATYIYAMLLFQFPELVISINEELQFRFLAAVFVMTFVVPGLSTLMLMKTGFVENMHLETLADRRWPFIFSIFIYTTVSVFFFNIFTADFYIAVIISFITFNMMLLGLISFFWKISIHASAMGGILAFYIVSGYYSPNSYPMYLLLLMLPLMGATMSSRLALNSHNLLQIVAGFCLGLLTGLSSLIVFHYV